MSLSMMDDLRIERAVYTVDFHTQDLPGRQRRAIRRELRTNLRTAAEEVGGKEAVRRLGNLRRVAADYLDAEYGSGPRPRWVSGLNWAVVTALLTACSLNAGSVGYFEGVLDAAPATGGTYSWYPFGGAGPGMDITMFPNGEGWEYALQLTIWPFVLYTVAFLVGARWWRLLRIRRHRATQDGATQDGATQDGATQDAAPQDRETQSAQPSGH